MAVKSKQSELPFIIQKHPSTYNGYPFITLLQHHHQHILTIVDNYDAKVLKAFVIDLCGPENVSEQMVITIAEEWYANSKNKYPLSFEFSKQGVTKESSKIYRNYNIDTIVRVIGPIFCFPMNEVYKIKRRKRRKIPLALVQS